MAEHFDSLTDCAICFKPRETPKILPCYHSFCGKCVDKLIQGDNIMCPIDYQIFSVGELRHDFGFGNYSDRLDKGSKKTGKQQSEHLLCGNCEKDGFAYWCETCFERLCKRCYKEHKKHMSGHKIIPSEDKQSFDDKFFNFRL